MPHPEGQAAGLLLEEPPSTPEERAGAQPAVDRVLHILSAGPVREGTWQPEPTSPTPWLEMVITEQEEPLVARGRCQARSLLHQGAPQERPALSSAPSQAQIVEKFSVQPGCTLHSCLIPPGKRIRLDWARQRG